METIFTSRITFCASAYVTNVCSAFILSPLSKYRASDICGVEEPRNPGKSTKSREIHKNTLNTAKFAWNLSHTCQYNIFETYLGNWGCVIAINLQIYLETSPPQQVNNVPKLPHKLCCEKLCTSHDVKSFAISSLRQQMIISVKKQKTRSSNQLKIDRFLAKLPRKFLQNQPFFTIFYFGKVSPKNFRSAHYSVILSLKIPQNLTFFPRPIRSP